MRVDHVLSRIVTESTGPAHSVPSLCDSLAACGATVHLHVLEPTILRHSLRYNLQTYTALRFPYAFRIGLSPAMKRGLQKAARISPILHSHSLWLLPNIYAGVAAAGTGCKLVVSPRGTLSGWALRRSRFKKRIAKALGQDKVLRSASLFHATSDVEYEEIRSSGYSAPVAVIPNGVDIPSTANPYKSHSPRRLLFLSRIHPKKGIDILLRCWQTLEVDFPDWELNVVGPLQNPYAARMQQLALSLGCRRVKFAGELTADAKSAAFYDADLFVLPTHSENFGMVVAESLAHGVPVVVTKNAPWKGVEDNGCGWWIDANEQAVLQSLRSAMQIPAEQLRHMGATGQKWIECCFSWSAIAVKMLQSYEWLLSGGPAPDWIKAL